MQKLIVLSVVLLFQVNPHARAQSSSPYAHLEIAGGVSMVSLGGTSRTQLYGWQATMATNFKRSFGIVSDFAGQYHDGINIRQALFGPQFNKRLNKATIFARGLVGTSREAGGNAFTLGTGGGLDLRLSDRFVYRVLQADWLPQRSGGQWTTDKVKLSSSIVISFNRR